MKENIGVSLIYIDWLMDNRMKKIKSRQLIENIKIISEDKMIIRFKSDIEIEQRMVVVPKYAN